jgi:O-antigen/teichoic acid export membrane protein
MSSLTQRTQSQADWRRFARISYATSLISLPSSYIDRFLLGFFAGTGPVGVLAVTRQLQQLPMIIFQMLLSVSSPMFSSAHARGEAAERDHLYGLVTDWAVKAALPLIIFTSLLAFPLLGLFGREFAVLGALPLQILMVAQLLNLASGPTGNMGMMSGLEREVFRIHVATTVGNSVLLLILTPLFGLLGIAVCFLANAIVSNISMLLMLRIRRGMAWWNLRYLRWLAPAAITAVTGVLFRGLVHSWTPVVLILALMTMYTAFGVTTLVQGLHDDDKALIALVGTRFGLKGLAVR